MLGAPETWRDCSLWSKHGGLDLRGAWISEIEPLEWGIALSTRDGEGGSAYCLFRIADPDIRNQTLAVLKVGMNVHAACKLPLG